MPHNDPTNYGLLTYLWIGVLSFWGGTVHHIQRIRSGSLPKFTFVEWIGDVIVSGFVGFVTFALCAAQGIEPMMSAAIVGIVSHQGTRGIMIIAKKIGFAGDSK